MAYHLKLKNKHVNFLFDSNGHLNVFNLVRLFRDTKLNDKVVLDVRAMKVQHQELIGSKFEAFLRLFVKIIPTSQDSVCLKYSNIHPSIIGKLCKTYGPLSDKVTLTLGFQYLTHQEESRSDPHFVKNIRGAVLLSLVQDLLDNGSVQKKISIFDEKSPLLLHSASDFLSNKENAEMMWSVLCSWEMDHEHQYESEINRRISRSLKAKKDLDKLSKELINRVLLDKPFSFFIRMIESKCDLPISIFASKKNIHIWFVDDQQANGWRKLISEIISGLSIDLSPLSGLEDVSQQLDLVSFDDNVAIPDIALVDLRLSESDQVIETYGAKDLSGFKVVDLLQKRWSGLPIMITSSSSKLWNMEKAIERGAVAYWRKSDEVGDCEVENAVLIAFDINFQFIEKLGLTLKKAQYRYVFRIVESLKFKINLHIIKDISLQRCIENYAVELEQKTSWMCWQKTDDTKTIDSLYLGVMEIFNEIEPLLWDPITEKLILVPDKKVRSTSRKSDNLVINDTLDYLDKIYDLGLTGLSSSYESCKSIRNKLPTVHGSEGAKDFKHASLENIEKSLLIVWCLLSALIQNKND
jgi:CheY-like chemotaxis protein